MSRFALRPAPPRTLPAGVAIVLLMLSGSGFVHAQANADAATTAPPVATSDAQRTTENARRASRFRPSRFGRLPGWPELLLQIGKMPGNDLAFAKPAGMRLIA